MPGARHALIAAAAGLAWLAAGPAAARADVVIDALGIFVWHEGDADFGGFSGLELSEDGSRYWALSDRGTIRWGSVQRSRQGRISGLTTAGTARLQDSQGRKLQPGYKGDAEGLAIDAQGRMFVSFEGLDRIARYDDPDRPAVPVPPAPFLRALQRNMGLEALAVTPSGDLLTIPEGWSQADSGFPVWRLRDGAWSNPFDLPREDGWAPVGADVGPDGRLYVLERDFSGLLGFTSRVRRYAMTDEALGPPETLIESVPRQYDNLEGIAVWRDGQGIRVTLISDDNFLFVQQTQLVEFRVRERAAAGRPLALSAPAEPASPPPPPAPAPGPAGAAAGASPPPAPGPGILGAAVSAPAPMAAPGPAGNRPPVRAE
ncbi:esterase-like activity of phytase family protein [Paracoccus contaminans]|uniref:Phytase-like domain-containing protein n=1 Tax=Paracoccus contaminans TaxID=1945662 RepID=A0A1W6CXJ7_9RHOB|nr:esterase-like activity of phytase family protein [Paracoccus contaminans]ARJ69580.1 hypothetical protein B0A89_08035 [Paracoccus contaminans]